MDRPALQGDVRNNMAGGLAGRHLCAGPRCITLTRNRLCQFCTRTIELAALMQTKPCLRCQRDLPLDSYAGNGRYRLCDECRWSYPMTDQERRISKHMAPWYESRRRRRAKYRQLRKAA